MPQIIQAKNTIITPEAQLEHDWLQLTEEDYKQVVNPIIFRTAEERKKLGYHMVKKLRNPKYFYTICKEWLADNKGPIELPPFQMLILEELWNRKFPMLIGSRGIGKTWLTALYLLLELLLVPATKAVIAGAAYRQSKFVFEYMAEIWDNSPILRDICGGKGGPKRDVDNSKMIINNSTATAIPIGPGGEKIRGYRARIVALEEFNSIPKEIAETVLFGFGAVSASPIEQMKHTIRRRLRMQTGNWTDKDQDKFTYRQGNKVCISGTCGYEWEDFADYHGSYHDIISSMGDRQALMDMMDKDETELPNHKDYGIIRIPYNLVEEGYLDSDMVMRAKATMHSGTFGCEYGAVFTADSEGFFKRSLIESCVARKRNVEASGWPIWCPTAFDPITKGDPKKEYVFAIDPASEQDNFALVIVELNPGHRRIVYTWSTNVKNFEARKKRKLVDKDDFYGFCVRKIRKLMQSFNCVHISIDSQGGVPIREGLHDPDKMMPGEEPIWEIIDPDGRKKDSDYEKGLHILEMVNFADAKWTSPANHALRWDLENKVLLFPQFDTVTVATALAKDKERFKTLENLEKQVLYDSLSDCADEIEELKNELSTIIMTKTSLTGRERWDTPEKKLPSGRKGWERKDRYSALLMANMAARHWDTQKRILELQAGGTADQLSKRKSDGKMFSCPQWMDGINQACGTVVTRGV